MSKLPRKFSGTTKSELQQNRAQIVLRTTFQRPGDHSSKHVGITARIKNNALEIIGRYVVVNSIGGHQKRACQRNLKNHRSIERFPTAAETRRDLAAVTMLRFLGAPERRQILSRGHIHC